MNLYDLLTYINIGLQGATYLAASALIALTLYRRRYVKSL